MNACGVDDFHDGVNYTRTSCVIAVSKAKDMFEPFLHQVRVTGGVKVSSECQASSIMPAASVGVAPATDAESRCSSDGAIEPLPKCRQF